MIEKLIVLEDIDPVIFYGVNNANIQLIKALYPKLRIVARGNVIFSDCLGMNFIAIYTHLFFTGQ